MEEKQDLSQFPLPFEVIRQGFANQLKELAFLNEHSPRIFMVYTHSLDEEKGAEGFTESSIARQIQGYLNPTILASCPSRNKDLKLNLYSAFASQGNGSDPHDEYKEADVLYRQLCLLPKHAYSVDYVILCGSYNLQVYSEIKEVGEYTNHLRKILSPELSKQEPDFRILYTQAESVLSICKSRCSERNQKFHSLYTELAFLQLRKEEKCKEFFLFSDLITIIIDKNPVTIYSSIPQDNHIYIGTAAEVEKDSKAFYLGIFQLLRRLFGKPGLDACRKAIENAHYTFITSIEPALWTDEAVKEVAEKHSIHEKRKTARQRTRAQNSFFGLSASSEEEFVTKVLSKPTDKIAEIGISTTEITEVLRVLYQQNCAKLPRLFSEEAEAMADTFVNVAILKEEVVQTKEKELNATQETEVKQRNVKEMQDNRLQSHERLYEVHEAIAIEELFAPFSNAPPPKKLLLYGRAGIGKTVLCQYIANQWAEPDTKANNVTYFRQFQAVFWIKLRELLDRLEDRRKRNRPISEEMIVAEMVTACCLRDSDWQEKTKKQQLQTWLKANAESTLFILDGYDEIAKTAATSCALSDCLHAVLSQMTYKPYVMLTSRPVAIDKQYSSFDRRLECMGFIDKNIPAFIKRYIKDVQQSKNCLTFLKTHPSIWGIAHIPLNLELLCWLWSKGELCVDNSCCTMAALYSRITTKMKEMNLDEQKHPNLRKKWQYADNHSSETTLADFAEEFFPFLGFYAMQQPGVLLKGRDIKHLLGIFIKAQDIYQKEGTAFDDKQRELLQACVDLSFLKSTQQGGKHLFDQSYYFIHLSFQEFFAAKYYQQAFNCSNIAVMEHFQIHKYTPSYQLTWWMTAGLLYQYGNYFGLSTFFKNLCAPPHDLIGVHYANLLSHCLDECHADERIDVVAGLTQHLARILQHLLEKNWLAGTRSWSWGWSWREALLRCSNLLHAKSFRDAGLCFLGKSEQIRFISSNTAVFLSHLVTEKVIACIKDRTIDSSSRGEFAQALAQRPGLTPEQIQSLIASLADTTIDFLARAKLAQILAQRSDLTPEQIQFLIACITNKVSHFQHRVGLRAFSLCSDLTTEEVQSLISGIINIAICDRMRIKLAQIPEQVQPLLTWVTDTMIDEKSRAEPIPIFIPHSNSSPRQVQPLITCVADTTGDIWGSIEPDQTLVQHPDQTSEEVQSLIACLKNTTITNEARVKFAQALAQHPGLTPKQVQSLIVFLRDTAIDYQVRTALAKTLVQRSDLTPEQIQFFIACITNTSIDAWVRAKLAQALTQAPLQNLNFNAQQLQQLLVYCLREEMLCKEYPFLIFSILRLYYSTAQIEQQRDIVLPGLSTFLIMPSTWFALAEQQALLLYDAVNNIALLRLGAQAIEFPLYLHRDPFFTLSYQIWGGSLYPTELEISKQKVDTYSPLQEIEPTLLLGPAKKIVTATTSTPMMLSLALEPTISVTSSTVQSHQRPYQPKTNEGIWADTKYALKGNKFILVTQDSRGLSSEFTEEVADEPVVPALKLTQGLENLIENSINTTKKYFFKLKRLNAFLLTIAFISSNESPYAVGRQLAKLQRKMKTCLQAASFKNYACKLTGEEQEILEVIGDKEVIDALADLLVRQGLHMDLAEASKYSAFFKAEEALRVEGASTLTCPMQ